MLTLMRTVLKTLTFIRKFGFLFNFNLIANHKHTHTHTPTQNLVAENDINY